MNKLERALLSTAIILFAFTLGRMAEATITNLPSCTEDVVLVGAGQFEDGHWSEYVCGPAADDFTGG